MIVYYIPIMSKKKREVIKSKNYSKKHKIYNKKKFTHKKNYGGKAVDAGSYGCVFAPPLKCLNNALPYQSTNITKLMYKEDTEKEMKEIEKVKKYVEQIPNKENYFIIANTYECNPDKLQKEDLINFDKECQLFTKRGITSANVNTKLNEVGLIVMPNGGLNIEHYLFKLFELTEMEMYEHFKDTNNALIKLLIHGIAPLNAMRFNHYDIKASNILMSTDGHARLIDWGLASENDGINIPETIQDRSIAFNMPFSDIFFDNFVKKWLPDALNEIKKSDKLNDKKTGQAELLKIVAVNMINKSIEKTSEGHFDYITNIILHNIYKIYAIKNMYNRIDYNVLSSSVLIEYIQAVLLTYVDEQGNFNDRKYFYEVFSKNVDIWGFLLAYVPIIEFGIGKFHIDIVNAICRILLKYCFSTEFATKAINVNELATELQSLNAIIDDLNINHKQKEDRKINKNSRTSARTYSEIEDILKNI